MATTAFAQHEHKDIVIGEYRGDGAGFDHPVELSQQVLRVLVRQPQASYLRDTKQPHPEDFFAAARIPLNLHKGSEIDLIVRGTGVPVTGADNDWFWVVVHAESNPRVVLFANGLSIALMASAHGGLHDVKSSWNSAAEIYIDKTYHYDGVHYRLIKTKDGTFDPAH